MMMQLSRPFRLSSINILLLGAATSLPFSSYAATSDETLYLAITVNNTPIEGLFRIIKHGDQFLISAADFKLLRLKTNTLKIINDAIVLVPQSGLSLKYDDLQQQLNIHADTDWLGGSQRLNTRGQGLISESQLSPEVTGVALNYSLYGSDQRYGQNLSAYTQLRTFGMGPGNLSSSFNSRVNHLSSGTNSDTQRLMTSWTYDNPDKLLTLTLGDSYTGTQSWTNSVRMGGVSLAHNYSQQPDFNTSTRDILSDTVALPSTVDLYVQGIRQSSRQVQPGQFTLNTAPVFTGNSAAQVVITDINGQQRVVDLNLYGSSLLLTPGLSSWSINTGWVREDYSYRSFSYDSSLMVTGNGRYGVNNNLTLEGHTEQGQALQNGGVGANYLLSPWIGILHGDYSASRHTAQTGNQWGLGWQWTNQILTASVSRNQRTTGYTDMSVLSDGQLSTRSDNAFVSWSTKSFGTMGMSWISREYTGQHREYAGLSWSRLFPYSVSVSASLTRSIGDTHDQTVYLSVSIPLSRSQSLNITRNQDSDSTNNQLSWSKSLTSDKPGWGANASVSQGDNATTHLDYSYRSTWSDAGIGYNHIGQQNNYYGTLSGAVGWFDGGFYAPRQLGDAFAIVDTNGVADIPVLLSHQPAGKTDSHGRLFLNQLVPYYRNNVSIDVLSLPEDYRALYVEKEAIPGNGNGALLNFSVYRTRALLMTVKDKKGESLAFAAPVTVQTEQGGRPQKGTTNTVVGYGGAIYLEDPPERGKVIVHQPGGDCQIRLPEKLPGEQAIVQTEAVCQ